MAISNNSTGIRPGVCTSTTRPTNPYVGQFIFETNTLLSLYWSGSAWVSGGGGVTSLSGTTNQITVSASTGAVTVSLPTNVTIAGNYVVPTNGKVIDSASANYFTPKDAYGNMYHKLTSGSFYVDSDLYYFRNQAGANTVTWDSAGNLTASGFIRTGTSITDANSVSCSGWFRSLNDTGWYSQTYGGGIHMSDSTWVRVYNNKNFYSYGEIRTNGSYSSNVSRQRGSYGDITIGSNGRSNDWGGIEFVSPETQTFMVRASNYSGMYRDNVDWNWLFDYSSLIIGSDERYKREIEPLNVGLDFIEQLEPVSFLKLTESPDDDPETTQEGYYYGFTAQNVRAALDAVGETRDVRIHDIGGANMGLVACTEDAVYDRQYIGVTEFLAPVVKAIQELNNKVKALEGA